MKQSNLNENEEDEIFNIKARLLNWRRCYAERPRQQQSIMAAVIRALKEALYEPNKHDIADSISVDVWKNPPDFRDADFIERVWVNMAHPDEADLRIPGTGVTIAVCKTFVFVYTFGDEKMLKDFLVGQRISSRYKTRTERQCLLYFSSRVRSAETFSNYHQL